MGVWKTVKLVGKPTAAVQIVPRDRGDDPPPPVLDGALNREGWLTIRLPQEYFVILHDGPTIPLRVDEVADGATIELG